MGKEDVGASLAVQWLRFCASSLWGVGSIPHQGLNEDPICCIAKKKKKRCGVYEYSGILLRHKINEILSFSTT